MTWWVHAESRPGWIGKNMWIGRSDGHGTVGLVHPFTLTTYKEGMVADKPTMSDETIRGDVDQFLQAAMDCAWSLGMRPRGFEDHTNELAAVRFHLDDMRKLAKVK